MENVKHSKFSIFFKNENMYNIEHDKHEKYKRQKNVNLSFSELYNIKHEKKKQ